MTLRSDQIPLAAIIAALGAVIGLGSLLLPWLALDTAGFEQFARDLGRILGNDATAELSSPAIQSYVDGFKDTLADELVGYKLLSGASVGVMVVLNAFTLQRAYLVASGDRSPSVYAIPLMLGGAALAFRPIYVLMRDTGSTSDLGAETWFSRLNCVEAHLFEPATGLYVALFGAAAVVVAGMIAQFGQEPVAPAQDAGDVAHVGGATHAGPFVPYGAAPQQAAATPQCDAPPAAPAPPAYGQQSSPYAQPAPAYAQAPSPYAQPQPETYGLAPAQQPQGPAPVVDRSGSVAPPGFS